VEIREILGVFIGGIITLALVATAVNKDSKTASVAQAFTDGFANDIRAATFQSGGASSSSG
jgi:hypothetical protein